MTSFEAPYYPSQPETDLVVRSAIQRLQTGRQLEWPDGTSPAESFPSSSRVYIRGNDVGSALRAAHTATDRALAGVRNRMNQGRLTVHANADARITGPAPATGLPEQSTPDHSYFSAAASELPLTISSVQAGEHASTTVSATVGLFHHVSLSYSSAPAYPDMGQPGLRRFELATGFDVAFLPDAIRAVIRERSKRNVLTVQHELRRTSTVTTAALPGMQSSAYVNGEPVPNSTTPRQNIFANAPEAAHKLQRTAQLLGRLSLALESGVAPEPAAARS